MKFNIVLKMELDGGGIIRIPDEESPYESENMDTLLAALPTQIPFDEQFKEAGMRKVGIEVEAVSCS